MILTLKLTARVPGKDLRVDGQVEFDPARLDRDQDKGAAFLLGAVRQLTEKVQQEVKMRTESAPIGPINDFPAVPHTKTTAQAEKPPISQPGATTHG